VTIEAAKAVAGDNQLRVGLVAGVEGDIHTMRLIWEEHKMEEDCWGFLLVDMTNAFNEGNCIALLWTVHHLWPSGDRFCLNVYQHWSNILIIQGADGMALVIMSQEGVTLQGADPMAMVVAAYGLMLLPFIKQLNNEHPDISHPRYADDAGDRGSFTAIQKQFESLQKFSPARGYFLSQARAIY
jgi:hypothetical protein